MDQQSLVLATTPPNQTKMPKSEASRHVNQETKQSFSSQLDKLTEEVVAPESATGGNAKSPEHKVTVKNEHVEASSGNKLPDDAETVVEVANVDEGSEEKLIATEAKLVSELPEVEKVAVTSLENGINLLVTQDAETSKEAVKNLNSSHIKSAVELQPTTDGAQQKSQVSTNSKLDIAGTTKSSEDLAPKLEGTIAKSSAALNANIENTEPTKLKSVALNDSPAVGKGKGGDNIALATNKAGQAVGLESEKVTPVTTVNSAAVDSVKSAALEKDSLTSQQKLQANEVVQYKTVGNDGVKLTTTANVSNDKGVIAKPETAEPEFNFPKRPVVAPEITAQSKEVTKSLDSIAVESSAGLRSDILHALSRRGISTPEKGSSDVIVTKDLPSSPLPIASKELMTEKTLLAQSVTQDVAEKMISKPSIHSVERRDTPTIFTNMNSLSASTSAATVVKTDVPVFDIQPSMQSAAWNRVLSGRVIWMAKEGVQEASLKLNPVHLGPVEVKLQVQHEQASVSFIAQNAATRDALEQALPRLRDSFNQNGLELANADISQQSNNQEELERQAQEAQGDGVLASQKEPDEGEVDNVIVSGQQAEQAGVSIYA